MVNIPGELKPDTRDDLTKAAVEEGKSLARDKETDGYTDIDALKAAFSA